MRKKATEIAKYVLALLFFYKISNFVRNVLLKPVIYDAFISTERRAVCVVGPYYSRRGVAALSCVCVFSGRAVTLRPRLVDDPDKSCFVALFDFPEDFPADFRGGFSFEYTIMVRGREIFSGTCVANEPSLPGRRKLSMATLFKYETDFLKEWIDYHRTVGVEHFYLYENNAVPDEKIAQILAPYVKEGVVTHIPWPYPYYYYNYKLRAFWPNDAHIYTQVPQINHCLYKYAAATEWLLCADVDEYFYSPRGGTLVDTIDAIRASAAGAGDPVASVRISGLWFGGTTADVEKAKTAGVRASFTRSEKTPSSKAKCIFSTSLVDLASVHNSTLRDGEEVNVPPSVLRFNHYRAMGWQRRIDPDFARDVENRDISTL